MKKNTVNSKFQIQQTSPSYEGRIKASIDKPNMSKCVSSGTALQIMVNRLFMIKRNESRWKHGTGRNKEHPKW